MPPVQLLLMYNYIIVCERHSEYSTKQLRIPKFFQ